jgi:hypothetical protein
MVMDGPYTSSERLTGDPTMSQQASKLLTQILEAKRDTICQLLRATPEAECGGEVHLGRVADLNSIMEIMIELDL